MVFVVALRLLERGELFSGGCGVVLAYLSREVEDANVLEATTSEPRANRITDGLEIHRKALVLRFGDTFEIRVGV